MKKKIFHKGIYGIIHSSQSLLLVKKSRGPYKGLWDLPGGRQEKKESLKETLAREIQEETGIVIGKWRFITILQHRRIYKVSGELYEFNHTGLIYKIEEFNDAKLDLDGSYEDVSGCEWKQYTEEEILTPFAKQSYFINKEFLKN